MVMEAPPSPQSVGREFVRQYYTLLNQAPTHLHRFYNTQSLFVHGGLDPPNRDASPVVGQKQIHQKIQQLNFRDCHAKITQVDAQATLGSGVVVQVTGELSNAGQPMRRFTQTFVLAAQSPKKYYVHNDIFRYQDEIVSDDECEPELRSEIEEELVVQERPPVMNEVPQPQPIPYYNPNAAPMQQAVVHTQQPAATLTHVLPQQPSSTVAAINGNLHPDDMNLTGGQISPVIVQPNLISPMVNLQVNQEETMSLPINEEIPISEPGMEDANYSMDGLNEGLNQDVILSNEPKTYATLLKSGGSPAYTTAPPVFNPLPPPKSMSPPVMHHFDNRDIPQGGNQMMTPGQRGGPNRGPRNNQPNRMPRQDSRSGKNNFVVSEDSSYEDRRKSHRDNSFGDSQQLFLGNLPHSATEEELRDIFSQFGTVVDLRIQPSTKGNSTGQRAPPNYGFITYENQQAVQSCLAAKPIRYPNNDKNGVPLNVEEKKTKDRLPYGGGNRSDNMGGPRGRDNGPPRRPGPPRGGGNAGGTAGPLGGGRPNSFNRPPPNRSANNTYNNNRR